MTARPKRRVVLRPVRPNLGVQAAYRRKIAELIDAMHASVSYWLEAAYRAHAPEMAKIAQDTAADELRDVLRKLAKQWTHAFDEAAQDLAEYFATDVAERSDAALQAALRKGGFAVPFVMTAAMRDVLASTVHANVSLIKTIPLQYLSEVDGLVMRSVQTGRDVGGLFKDLRARYDLTKYRAGLIARDQNNKATSAFQRARQIELGIEKAVWMHSHAGKKPRPTHVKMDGKEYDVKKGMWDSAVQRYVWPGTEINCRCVGRSVVVPL